MKFWNLENFKKGPVTTILGIVIILASVVSVFIPSANISWTEAVVGITAGSILLGVSDPKNSGGTALLTVGVILMAMLMLGCKSSSTTTKRTDTTYIPTKVYVKGDCTRTEISSDMIKALVLMRDQGKAPIMNFNSYTTNPATGDKSKTWSSLQIGIDSLNRLYAQCKCRDSMFNTMMMRINSFEQKTVYQDKEVIPWWISVVLIIMGILLILLTIKSFVVRR